MQRNYYSDRFLDEDFEEAIKAKEKQILVKYNVQALKDIYFDNAQKVNQALIDFKPNRHQRQSNKDYKRLMLEYLDRCINEDLSNFSYREKEEFDSKYVSQVASQLSFLGFRIKQYVPFFIGASLAIDILLTILGVAKYYYYIPIIFILVTYAQLKGLYKAKKTGKLLR